MPKAPGISRVNQSFRPRMSICPLRLSVPILMAMASGYFAAWTRVIESQHALEFDVLPMDIAPPATMQRWVTGRRARASWVRAFPVTQLDYGTVYAGLTLAWSSMIHSALTLTILAANASSIRADKRGRWLFRACGLAFLKPVMLSPIGGILFAFIAVPVPGLVRESFTLIGQVAAGGALLLTALALTSRRHSLGKNALKCALPKAGAAATSCGRIELAAADAP
jgi:hypothetical protein